MFRLRCTSASLIDGGTWVCGCACGVVCGDAERVDALDLACVISRRASCSSCATRFCATATSLACGSLRNTGNGLLARRFASVLPPPSRWCCAWTSALVGLVLLLALTSTTSIGWLFVILDL